MSENSSELIAVVGLGYVGLPLALAFGKNTSVLGFDIDLERIENLQLGVDDTLEVSAAEFKQAVNLSFTSDINLLKKCDTYIVTVPTPVDEANRPDMFMIKSASRLVGKLLEPGNTVIYESTVYPGATEEECVPILEEESKLAFNSEFFVGYSPERINPGDKQHRLTDIVKVTSGSNESTAAFVDQLYQGIIKAGTCKVSSIKVAEAAKVIENIQRDVNIALVNDLAMLFAKLELDTSEVLTAAETKWNFLKFRPGLVGGHCIGVDPYYLTFKADQVGYHPALVLAGRRINDHMAAFAASQLFKAMSKSSILSQGAKILVFGFSFKENCPDLRNTKVADLVYEMEEYGAKVDIVDPWVSGEQATKEYGVKVFVEPPFADYDAVVLAVAHQEFIALGAKNIRKYCRGKHVLFDLKGCFNKEDSDLRL